MNFIEAACCEGSPMKRSESFLHRLCGLECGWYGAVIAVFVMLAILVLILAGRLMGVG